MTFEARSNRLRRSCRTAARRSTSTSTWPRTSSAGSPRHSSNNWRQVMPTLAALLAALQTAATVKDFVLHQVDLLKQQGQITDEQFQQVLSEAKVSDDNFDAQVSAARQRL